MHKDLIGGQGKEVGLKRGLPLDERSWGSCHSHSQSVIHAFFTGISGTILYSYLVLLKLNYTTRIHKQEFDMPTVTAISQSKLIQFPRSVQRKMAKRLTDRYNDYITHMHSRAHTHLTHTMNYTVTVQKDFPYRFFFYSLDDSMSAQVLIHYSNY